MSDVPRRAVFDDLRIGMVVAYDCNPWLVGTIDEVAETEAWGMGFDGTPFSMQVDDDHGGQIVVLRDAPAPPVTVRREDYDALVAAEGKQVGDFDLHLAARALIDHADTGSDYD